MFHLRFSEFLGYFLSNFKFIIEIRIVCIFVHYKSNQLYAIVFYIIYSDSVVSQWKTRSAVKEVRDETDKGRRLLAENQSSWT